MINVTEITEYSAEVKLAFERLLPQLSSNAQMMSDDELKDLIDSKASIVLAATDTQTNQILGCMTLVVFRIPTGIRAWIEDVVVDYSARGKGVGQALIESALQRAKQEGAKTVDLTSRPAREAANRLYTRCGFDLRNTNIYRYSVK